MISKMVDINTAIKNLSSLADDKIKHLKDILSITYKQKEVIEKQDIDMLTEYVAEKQKHIDIIDSLDQKFEVIYQNIRDELGYSEYSNEQSQQLIRFDEGNYTGNLYKELRGKIQEAQDIMKNIFELEKENNKKANQIMENLKEKIRAINVGQKSYKAYKNTAPLTDGIYIDKKR